MMDQFDSKRHSLYDYAHDIQRNLETKTYTVSAKRGRSRLWEVFGKIETDTGETIEDFVSCRRCHKVYKFCSASTSNLVRHKCYTLYKLQTQNSAAQIAVTVQPETKKNLEDIISQWTIDNCRPVDVIEDAGLQKLAEFCIAVGSKYGPSIDMEDLIPQAEEILKNVTKLYADHSAKLKNELTSIRNCGYALTTGMWRDDYFRKTYVLLMIHYVKNGELINRFLGMESIEGDKCTDEDIKQAAEEILETFDCSLNDELIFVTEKNENMKEAFQSCESIYCINHLFQYAIEEAIEGTTEIQNICEMSRKLFHFLEEIDYKFASSVENCAPNRWNIIFHILSTIATNWNEALQICKSHKGELSELIQNLSLKEVTALQEFLEPFDGACKDMDRINSATLHLAIVHAHRLRKLCVKNINDLDIIKKFKLNLLKSFDKFVWQNMTLHHKVALYLFPPANKLISFSASDRDLIRAECKRIMQTYYVEQEEQEQEEEVCESSVAYSAIQIDDKQDILDSLTEINDLDENVPSTSAKSMTTVDIFKDFVIMKVPQSTVEDKVNMELRLYDDTNIMLQDNFNLIQWWHLHQANFPLLYKASCKILAVPATTIAADRAILKARSLIFENRSPLDAYSNSVNEILFLHFNMEQNENDSDKTF